MLIISMMMMMMENLHEIEFVYRIWLQEVGRGVVTNRLLLTMIIIMMNKMIIMIMIIIKNIIMIIMMIQMDYNDDIL